MREGEWMEGTLCGWAYGEMSSAGCESTADETQQQEHNTDEKRQDETTRTKMTKR